MKVKFMHVLKKNILYMVMFMLIISACTLCGCGDRESKNTSADSNSSSGNITEELEDKNMMQGEDDMSGAKSSGGSKSDGAVDVDLTALSSTMVYGEVYNMMMQPDDYIGKDVKMEGEFAPYLDEATGKYYFACIVKDATACCAQGIEFELAGDYSYPYDYPAEGATICVVGCFDTYTEGGNNYCVLRNATLEIK